MNTIIGYRQSIDLTFVLSRTIQKMNRTVKRKKVKVGIEGNDF